MEPEPYLNILVLNNFVSIFSHSLLYEILGIIILLFISGLISGSEIAFFNLSPTEKNKLQHSKSSNCRIALLLIEKPNFLLATILIANNFVNVAIIILSTYITSSFVEGINNEMLIILLQLVGITFMILLFGEIFPKIIAERKSLKFAQIMARPLNLMIYTFYPLSYLLVKSTKIVNKRLEAKHKNNISMEELSHAIELASEELKDEKEMLEGIVNSKNLEVKEIMTRRVDVFAIEYNSTFSEVIHKIVEAAYSRIPVYIENLDNIKGILYIKDVLPYIYLNNKDEFRWQKLIRPHYIVPESKKINELLKDFQMKKLHIAIVVDEYGGVSGLVTLEDILEEFVGEINDESDLEEPSFEKISDNEYIFDAKISIVDFCKVFDVDYAEFQEIKGESDSLAGLILEIKGEIPDKNTTIKINNFEFTVNVADDRRIKKIKVKHKNEDIF